MSNPNQTPTYEQPAAANVVTAQNAGGLATSSTTEVLKVHEWTALSEPETLSHWPGFDSNGNVKPSRLSRQARLKEKEELRRQAVDVTREENSFLDVA